MEVGIALNTGPIIRSENIILDSSELRVYYESVPEVDCGSVVYRLHSGVTFSVRVIKELEVD